MIIEGAYLHYLSIKVLFLMIYKFWHKSCFCYFQKEDQMYLNKVEGISATFENPFVCVPQELEKLGENGQLRRPHIIFSNFGKINEKPKSSPKA